MERGREVTTRTLTEGLVDNTKRREGVEGMGTFHGRQRRRSNEPRLPSDIIHMMERFGRYEFNPQANADDAADIGQMMAELYPFASADPDGFLVALARAVLPVSGWAAYGASRVIWELLSPSASESVRQHPSYKAIMSAAIEFLRANGVPPMMVRGYEWDHWLASGGTIDTWLPRLPTPSPEEAPIAPLLPGESRKVAQLTSKSDSAVILVRRDGEGRYCALIDAKRSEEDPRRVQNEWKSAGSLYELYIAIGLSLQTPQHWCDSDLEPYFPLPRLRHAQQERAGQGQTPPASPAGPTSFPQENITPPGAASLPPAASPPERGAPSTVDEAGDEHGRIFSDAGSRRPKEAQLSLFANARTTLERDDRAFVGKSYAVQAGIAQSRPEHFSGESFELSVRDPNARLTFDISIHASENLELTTAWYADLAYNTLDPKPQLVTFVFRVLARGSSTLALDFYHGRRRLKTIRFDFDAIEEAKLASAPAEV